MYNLKGFACRSDKSTESYQQILASCLDSTAHNFTVLFQSHSSHQVKGKKNRKTLNWRQKKKRKKTSGRAIKEGSSHAIDVVCTEQTNVKRQSR